MSVRDLYLLALAASIGCAHSGAKSETPLQSAPPRQGTILTAEEVYGAKADVGSAYDAIARLRPNWLAARGSSSFVSAASEYAIVFVEGHHHGDLATLRNIPAFQVLDFHYYDLVEAGARFGLQGGVSGVIDLTMKTR